MGPYRRLQLQWSSHRLLARTEYITVAKHRRMEARPVAHLQVQNIGQVQRGQWQQRRTSFNFKPSAQPPRSGSIWPSVATSCRTIRSSNKLNSTELNHVVPRHPNFSYRSRLPSVFLLSYKNHTAAHPYPLLFHPQHPHSKPSTDLHITDPHTSSIKLPLGPTLQWITQFQAAHPQAPPKPAQPPSTPVPRATWAPQAPRTLPVDSRITWTRVSVLYLPSRVDRINQYPTVLESVAD